MCARYSRHSDPQVLADFFKSAPLEPAVAPPPNFNVAPTQQSLVVLDEPRRLEVMRWGLIPAWARDARFGARTINARAETVADKPAFRAAFRARRCLVPADGFYEWTGPRNRRQPHYIHRADGHPLALAGLWEWHAEFGLSFTIITTAPSTWMSAVHSRMPAILEPGDWDAWLSPGDDDPGWQAALLCPAAENVLRRHPVSRDVNTVASSGPELIQPITAPESQASSDRDSQPTLFGDRGDH
ncbi:MAG: SOS response-associated peptidase [Chloroflexi bacterium]|nr:SOS response-associated peptidase [Chloroflexota bacterium]